MLAWYYLILASSVLNGLATLVEKRALKTHYATAFSAALTPLVALVSLLFIPLANFDMSSWQLLLIIAWSALNAYTYLLAARVFRHGELSASSAAFGSLPTLVVVVLAFVFLSEQLSAVQYVGIIGMIVATYMLFFRGAGRKSGHYFESGRYRYLVLFAVFVSGTASVLNKYVITGVNPYAFLIVSSVSMSVFFTIFISLRYKGIGEMVQTFRSYKLPISLGAIFTAGYRLTFYLALILVPVSLAQPLGNTFYVIITVAIGGLVFGEEDLARKLVLSAFLVFFAYLLVL